MASLSTQMIQEKIKTTDGKTVEINTQKLFI